MYNSHAIEKVLTGLYLNNDLIISNEYPLRLEDFVDKKYQAIYTALYNLYVLGNSHVDINDIVGYFREQQGMYEKFITDGGMDVLYQICNDNTPLNFDYNYSLIKKQSLLRDFNKIGVDVSDIYDKTLPPEQFEKQMAKFNALDIDDIFKHYEGKINNLQSKYQNLIEKSCMSVGEGIEELYKELQSVPEIGLPLEGEIYNTITRGARLKKLYIDSGSSGSGKALVNGSKVYTPHGPVRIEDLKVGDEIFGEDGKIYNVSGVFPQGKKKAYRIVFNDRTFVDCCDEHLWTYQTANQRGKKSPVWNTKTLREIIDTVPLQIKTSASAKVNKDTRWNIFIPIVKPVEYPRTDLPIPPYLLGAMLGDGYLRASKGSAGFTNEDPDVVNRVKAELTMIGGSLNSIRGTDIQFTVISKVLKQYLIDTTLEYCHSWDKFIPDIYKYSSIEDRIALLQGICDTDGSVANGNSIDITLKSKRLIEDIQEVCESLGMTATMYIKENTGYKINNTFINCGTAYRLYIKLNPDIEPIVWCSAKRNKIKNNTLVYRNIRAIIPLEEEREMTCITTTNPTRLFLTDHYVATHNSRRMVGNACKLAIPIIYNNETETWENTGVENKVLYITTELEHAEIQTLVLAYVSGINEDKILNNKYSDEERERVELAIQYIQQHNNIIIEFLPNPTLTSIQTTIKKHVLQDDVEYVFYDYIHITSGLTEGRDKNTRDDVILMLLSDTLKNLANELNVHVSTATQLNGDYEEKEVKNQNLIRGSKAVADKADIGAITLPLNNAEQELATALAVKLGTYVPNFITDIYKNRRGKWTAVRIWRYIDLGTCRTIDCFITDRRNEPIDFDSTKVQVKQASKVGGFVVIDNKTDPYKDFGQEIRVEE